MATYWHKLADWFYVNRIKLAETVLALLSAAYVKLYLTALFVLNILNWLLAFYVNRSVSQNLVVLHYNVNLGVNLIGSASDIYIIPTLGLTFIVINFLLLLNIFRRGGFFVQLILAASLLINLFLIAGTVSIYLINFR